MKRDKSLVRVIKSSLVYRFASKKAIEGGGLVPEPYSGNSGDLPSGDQLSVNGIFCMFVNKQPSELHSVLIGTILCHYTQ